MSCGAPGEAKYTASVTFERETYHDSKTKQIVINHTLELIPEVSATCETDGNEEYWECSACKKAFYDVAGKKPITGSKPIIPATGHTIVKGEDSIYRCTTCNKRFTVTAEQDGTTITMYSMEEDAVILQDEKDNSEEKQEDSEAQSEDEQAGEVSQGEQKGQNGEIGQSEPGGRNEHDEQSEQDGQSGQSEQNAEENRGDIPDMLENAARYGLIYPEGEEADSVPENTWEESAINLRVTSAGKTAPQTGREQQQQQQQGHPLWISLTVLSVLAGVVLVLLCKRKVVDDKR